MTQLWSFFKSFLTCPVGATHVPRALDLDDILQDEPEPEPVKLSPEMDLRHAKTRGSSQCRHR
jgi:hypothetical protein